MKAILDFTPGYCPNCGAALFKPIGGAAGLDDLRQAIMDYLDGKPFDCACGLRLEHKPGIVEPLCNETDKR